MSLDGVFHFHGFQDHQHVALSDLGTLVNVDLDHRGLHGGGDGAAGDGGLVSLALLRLALGRACGDELLRQGDLDAAAIHLYGKRAARGRLRCGAGVGVGTGGGCWQFAVPFLLDPAGVDVEAVNASDERRVIHHGLVERDHGGKAGHHVLAESAAGTLDGFLAGAACDDELGQHGVKLATDHRTCAHARIHAHAGAGRLRVGGHRAGGGHEVRGRVFAIDAELDGMAAGDGIAVDTQLLAAGDAELLAHQVDAGGFFGDGVFDLQAGIDLQEGNQAVRADEVFHRARAVVTGLAADGLRGGVDALALSVCKERCRRLLHELLKAALQRAIAGAHDDDVAVLIRQHLGLHVAGLIQVALHEALAATECGCGLARGGFVELRDLLAGVGHLHAAAAAAECGLNGNRQAVLVGEGDYLVSTRNRVLRARCHRGLRGLRDVACSDLVAEGGNGVGGGADPGEPCVDDLLGELRVFRKETVARVDRVCTGFARGRNHLVHVQVALGGGCATEREGLVCQLDKRRIRVGLGVHGDRRQPLVHAGADDAHGDLAAVRHQYLGHAVGEVSGRCRGRHEAIPSFNPKKKPLQTSVKRRIMLQLAGRGTSSLPALGP